MTRINLVPVQELHNAHLLAEWREMKRIPNNLVKGKYRLTRPFPDAYTVRTNDNPKGGEGHITFFLDKLAFLHARYHAILDELEARGIPQMNMWPAADLRALYPDLWGDYTPTPEALALNRKRIEERKPKEKKSRR